MRAGHGHISQDDERIRLLSSVVRRVHEEQEKDEVPTMAMWGLSSHRNRVEASPEQSPFRLRLLAALSLLMSGACWAGVVLMSAMTGFFARYANDDYCTAGSVLIRGFMATQLRYYQGWSGRFSFNFVVGLAGTVGSRIVPVLPAFLLVLWCGALIFTLCQIALLLRFPEAGWGAPLVALTVVGMTVQSTPDPIQSLYWQTGSLTYTVPLILLTWYAGLLIQWYRQRTAEQYPRRIATASAALAFVAGGFNETSLVVETVTVLLALGLWVRRRAILRQSMRFQWPPLVAGCLGSLCALAFVMAAPGNAARQAFFPPHPGVVPIISTSAQAAWTFWLRSLPFDTFVFLMMLPLPFLLVVTVPAIQVRGSQVRSITPRTALWSCLMAICIVALLLCCCFAPAEYAESADPPGRTMIIAQFLLVLASAGLGYGCGVVLRTRWRGRSVTMLTCSAFVILATVGGPLGMIKHSRAQLPAIQRAAAQWDVQDHRIHVARAAGARRVTIAVRSSSAGPDGLNADPADWVNGCAKDYYGVIVSAGRY